MPSVMQFDSNRGWNKRCDCATYADACEIVRSLRMTDREIIVRASDNGAYAEAVCLAAELDPRLHP